jgi:hypothetical protein
MVVASSAATMAGAPKKHSTQRAPTTRRRSDIEAVVFADGMSRLVDGLTVAP